MLTEQAKRYGVLKRVERNLPSLQSLFFLWLIDTQEGTHD